VENDRQFPFVSTDCESPAKIQPLVLPSSEKPKKKKKDKPERKHSSVNQPRGRDGKFASKKTSRDLSGESLKRRRPDDDGDKEKKRVK